MKDIIKNWNSKKNWHSNNLGFFFFLGVDPIIDHVQDKKKDVDLRAHIKNALSPGKDESQGVVHIHGKFFRGVG